MSRRPCRFTFNSMERLIHAMAGHPVSGQHLAQFWFLAEAHINRHRAARVKVAADRRVRWAGDITRQNNAGAVFFHFGVPDKHRREGRSEERRVGEEGRYWWSADP